jgi:hypothetical protein
MRDDTDLPAVLKTETEELNSGVSAEDLAALIYGIGADGDHFLIAERLGGADQVYMQVWRDGDGPYELEHRDGGPKRHFKKDIWVTTEVVGLFLDWIHDEGDWRGRVAWEPYKA